MATNATEDNDGSAESEDQIRSRAEFKPWRDKNTLEYLRLDRELSYREMGGLLGCSGKTAQRYSAEYEFDKQRYPWRDKERLQKLASEGLTVRQIADRLGGSSGVICGWLERFDIELQSRPWQDSEVLTRLYIGEQLSATQISNRLGCTPRTVCRNLAENEIPRRDSGDYGTSTVATDGTKASPLPSTIDDPNELRRLYFQERLSQRAIAAKIGCSHDVVRDRFDEFDIEVTYAGTPPELSDPATLRDLHHAQELTTTEIAKRFDVDPQTVANNLRWNRIPVQERKPAGEEHPMWAGGLPNYGKGWTKAKKQLVRKRDRYQCRTCGISADEHREKHGRTLIVHHIARARMVPDPIDRNGPRNLVTICQPHHKLWERVPVHMQFMAFLPHPKLPTKQTVLATFSG